MNNLRNQFRLRRGQSTNGTSLAPNASDTLSNWTAASQRDSHSVHTNANSRGRRVRQLGCHKNCCGGFCLRVGGDTCCAHASENQSSSDNDNIEEEDRLCSFCCDRRREERRTLERMDHLRQCSLMGPEDALTTTSGSRSTDSSDSLLGEQEEESENGISKACCGVACRGPSYTHCCEHNDLRFFAANGFHSGLHGLVPSYESYCNLCRDRCRRRAVHPGFLPGAEDDTSVGAVRCMPVPAGRRSEPPNNDWESDPQNKMEEQLGQLGDSNLEECVAKCLSCIECPVCLEPFEDDPCTLPCGHSMCLTHIHSMDRCPICRWPIHKDWKEFAQPSISLRETATAVKEAVDLMVGMEARLQKSEKAQAVPVQWAPTEARGAEKAEIMSSTTSTTSYDKSNEEKQSPSPAKLKPPIWGISVDC